MTWIGGAGAGSAWVLAASRPRPLSIRACRPHRGCAQADMAVAAGDTSGRRGWLAPEQMRVPVGGHSVRPPHFVPSGWCRPFVLGQRPMQPSPRWAASCVRGTGDQVAARGWPCVSRCQRRGGARLAGGRGSGVGVRVRVVLAASPQRGKRFRHSCEDSRSLVGPCAPPHTAHGREHGPRAPRLKRAGIALPPRQASRLFSQRKLRKR